MTLAFSLLAIGIVSVSGIPGILLPRSSNLGQRISVFLICLGSMLGLTGVTFAVFSPDHAIFVLPWQAAPQAWVSIDALSAFFLVPIYFAGSLGSVFGLGYWPQKEKKHTAPLIQFFWGTLMGGMSLLVISQHALSFLMGWEVMALSAFFLISAEDDQKECRKSGLIYLIATHTGTLVLFGMFVLWRHATGSFDLTPMHSGTASIFVVNSIFFLALLGFGLKAGIMPLHFWLPGAHANAPSHVSAVLSGVLLKMGIYGIVRMLSLLPDPPALWGGVILFAGSTSGLLGVIFALAQHDLKRLLAYHSIENIGIILLGLGLAMLGRTYNQPEWIYLGMAGCLLHTWNHSLFKSLLFFGAGSVLHRTHTRQMDQLGGLAALMPWTSGLFLIGAVAICGLPPLNGFISEFFVYLGLFQTTSTSGNSVSMAMLAAPVLAMIGALAVACFVKVYGTVFLGIARTSAALQAREAPGTMIWPMIVLAAACLTIGLYPDPVCVFLEKAIQAWIPSTVSFSQNVHLEYLVPFSGIRLISISLIVIFLVFALFMKKQNANKKVGTWDCGYARPEQRMQYTASSFAQPLVRLFWRILKPETHGPSIHELFPKMSTMNSHVNEVVLDRSLIPGFRSIRNALRWFYRFQQGQTQMYLLYILFFVLLMLSSLIPFERIASTIFKSG